MQKLEEDSAPHISAHLSANATINSVSAFNIDAPNPILDSWSQRSFNVSPANTTEQSGIRSFLLFVCEVEDKLMADPSNSIAHAEK
jgi:hypothetical protein